MGREEVGALAVVPQLSRVRTLVLAGCRLVDPGKQLPILFGTPFLSGLRRLDLSGTKLSSRELGAPGGECRSRDTPRTGPGRQRDRAEGGGSLAESAQAEGLCELSLAMNPIGDAGGKALARSAQP